MLKTPSPTLLFFSGSTSLPVFSTLSPQAEQEDGMGVAVSSSHVVFAAPSSSGGGLLTLLPYSSMGSIHQERVLHELLQHGSFTSGCSPSGTGFSSVGPTWGHKPCQQTCSGVGSSLHESTGLALGSALVQISHGVTTSFGHLCLLWHGVLPVLQVDICSTMDLHGVQGDSLPHHGLLLHELQGNLCSGAWSTFSPVLLHWPWCLQNCFSHRVSLLSPAAFSVAQQLFPLFNYVTPEALPPPLMGSALANPVAELPPPPPPPCCRNLAIETQYSGRSHSGQKAHICNLLLLICRCILLCSPHDGKNVFWRQQTSSAWRVATREIKD